MILTDRRKIAASMLAVLALNVYIVRELFTTEYTRHVGSIAGAYVSIARYISANWGDLTWSPLWYGGVPFQNMYPPLLHVIVAAVVSLTGISPALAHNAVTAAFYCLGAVTLYWLAARLSGDRLLAFCSALIYSLLSPSAFLIPVVAGDMSGAFHARRLQALVQYGEGPHITSLALLPVALIAFDWAYRKRRAPAFLAAAVALSSVVLSNWLGGFALAAAVVCYLLANSARLKDWAWAAALGAFSYALASPWIPPGTLAAVRANAQRIGGDFRMGLEQVRYFVILLILVVLADQWMARRRISAYMRFAGLFTLVMAAITLSHEWFNLYFLPQPDRYHLAMEMGFALLLPTVVAAALAPLRRNPRRAILCALLVFAFLQARAYRRYAREVNQPLDFTGTPAFKSAQWFKNNLPAQRAIAAGSVAFWMNAFTDTPQLGGGFEQGIINLLLPHAIFQIYSGMGAGSRAGEISILWLRAFGVHAVAVNGRNSDEPYKTFADPDKFKGLLKELWRDGDDVIYEVPHRSTSLARVIDESHVPPRAPTGGLDIGPVEMYVRALEDPALPAAEWSWRSRHSAVISASLGPLHLISVQESWHPGWSARVNGESRPVLRDALGQMLIKPACSGACTVELNYDGGWEMLLARLSSGVGLLAGVVASVRSHRRRRT